MLRHACMAIHAQAQSVHADLPNSTKSVDSSTLLYQIAMEVIDIPKAAPIRFAISCRSIYITHMLQLHKLEECLTTSLIPKNA